MVLKIFKKEGREVFRQASIGRGPSGERLIIKSPERLPLATDELRSTLSRGSQRVGRAEAKVKSFTGKFKPSKRTKKQIRSSGKKIATSLSQLRRSPSELVETQRMGLSQLSLGGDSNLARLATPGESPLNNNLLNPFRERRI